jgi:enoyl-CoA hydratase/carnithine racemase
VYQGEALSWRHEGPVLLVDLHRAPLNEIGTTSLRELEGLARYLTSGAGDARVLVWTSSQPGFCAGADLRELYRGLSARRDQLSRAVPPMAESLAPLASAVRRVGARLLRVELRMFIERIHAAFDTFDQSPIPTVAAVHGVVFGGGFELALTADLIIADKSARFCFPELRLGLIPGFGGVPRMNRDLGNGVVRDLLLSGRSLNATRAHEVGLVSQVVARGEAKDAAMRLAEQIGRFEPATTAAAKKLAKPLPRAALDQEKELFCDLATRPAVLEALERFVNDSGVRPYASAGGEDE